ncbi:hypothetical protein AN191_15235 [Loktanella sp. 5RATIMAR09]|uniref:hypothetical protein n=1 Tax=Loktanella sp. 5RATIMAR09 TaxID=1225655 RepID=UPI0006EB7C6E|nr:hypothetical protein [Loktanella sp. 5RATIMAR09]KQI71052.1 hypothetical protein AN191_15235 [Loktanella sp. 5RATIMAR09]
MAAQFLGKALRACDLAGIGVKMIGVIYSRDIGGVVTGNRHDVISAGDYPVTTARRSSARGPVMHGKASRQGSRAARGR